MVSSFTTLYEQGDYIHIVINSVLQNLLLGAILAIRDPAGVPAGSAADAYYCGQHPAQRDLCHRSDVLLRA